MAVTTLVIANMKLYGGASALMWVLVAVPVILLYFFFKVTRRPDARR